MMTLKIYTGNEKKNVNSRDNESKISILFQFLQKTNNRINNIINCDIAQLNTLMETSSNDIGRVKIVK